MNRISKNFLIICLIFSLFTPYFPVFAAETDDFNPNFLISDEEIQNWTSMSREDIQAFLVHYNSYLIGFRAADVNGVSRTASDIIARAAADHKINPKYLLVKLQKEQSLITDPSPSQKQLDWATGYSICDSCSMDDPTLQKNKGFGMQVDSAAGIIRWYYDNLNQESWIKRANNTYNIDGTNVRPLNLATAFLYTYTPHIHGNRNFWNLWKKWFDQVYPNGTLAKSASTNIIYLLRDGKKQPFSNNSALITRFDPKLVIAIPDAELNKYETGQAITLPNYSIIRSNGNYYLLDFDRLRPFASYNVVKQLGYNPDEIVDIDAGDIATYTLGSVIGENTKAPLGRVVRIKENKKLYYMDDVNFYPITDEKMVKINFPNLAIEPAVATDLANLNQSEPIKFKNGIILGIEGSNKIYTLEDGKKRHIADESVFNGMGYDWKNIIWTDQFTGMNHPTGQPIYLRREIQIADTTYTPSSPAENSEPSSSVEPVNKMIQTPTDKITYEGPQFTTNINTYLIADYETGKILAGKNIDDQRPPASFVKVMTAYQLMKEGINLNRSTTYDPADHKATYHSFRIEKGEKVLNKYLLAASMISSINTATRMLVDSVEEDESTFISKMNDQAKAWGLKNTVFADVTGESLDNKTTARDYLTIYLNSTKNADVSMFMGTKSYEYDELLDVDGKPHHFDTNTNSLVGNTNLTFSVIHSKTGYLDESGAGLTMLVQNKSNNKKYIIITMGNPDYKNRFSQPKLLTEWALEQF